MLLYIYIQQTMVASLNRGTLIYTPQNTIILLKRTLKRLPRILGYPHAVADAPRLSSVDGAKGNGSLRSLQQCISRVSLF